MKIVLVLLSVFMLSGCVRDIMWAPDSAYNAVKEANVAYYKAKEKPTITMECSPPCSVSKFTYNSPLFSAPTIQTPKSTIEVIADTVKEITPWGVVGYIAGSGIKNAGSTTANITGENNIIDQGKQRTINSADGGGKVGSGDVNQRNLNNATSTPTIVEQQVAQIPAPIVAQIPAGEIVVIENVTNNTSFTSVTDTTTIENTTTQTAAP